MTAIPDVESLLARMTAGLSQLLADGSNEDALLVGIHTGGAWLAERLHERLGLRTPLGTLDISFYRDDFSRKGMHPEVRPSRLPLSIEGRPVILVDDVLYTGRTVRAALNELFDYGRPASVRLAVLIERDGRELPVAADVAGHTLTLGRAERIKLRGPDPLRIERSHVDP